jgi:predicted choloylglycine hydrolase
MKKLKFIFSLIGTMIFSGCSFDDEIKALKTLKKLDDGLYFIEYIGDYDFDAFLAQGGNKTNEEMADFLTKSLSKGKWNGSKNQDEKSTVKITTPNFGCSSIVAKNQNGQTICGRNYDWKDCSVMIIHTKPNNGYESISTCCLEFLGYERNWIPAYKFPNDMMALATIYVPLDGMNEKGLYIADLVNGDNETTAQNRGKTPLTITTAIRLVLDKAATVDEAVKLLDSVDIHSVIDTAHHFAISDANGKSVVVEWVDNKMYVTETKVVTNHYTAESPKQGVCTYENSKDRFSQLEKIGTENNWIMNAEQIKEALKSVRAGQYEYSTHELTVWSSVYEPKERRITYYLRENYEKPIIIEF